MAIDENVTLENVIMTQSTGQKATMPSSAPDGQLLIARTPGSPTELWCGTGDGVEQLGGGGSSSGGSAAFNVTQTNHGFNNEFVSFNGTQWVKAYANDITSTTQVLNSAIGFATSVSSDVFTVTTFGKISGSGITDSNGNELVAGEYYFLCQEQDNAGKVTKVRPTSGTIQTVLQALSSTEFVVSIQEPINLNEFQYGGSQRIDFTGTNIVAGILTLKHALNTRNVLVSIYNNTSTQVSPNSIVIVDESTIQVDLSSQGSIAGTWYAVVQGGVLTELPSEQVNVTVFNAVGNANHFNSADGKWYEDSSFTNAAVDDTQALLSAIAYAKTNNKALYFPRNCNCLISSTLDLSGVDVFSEGAKICSNSSDDFTMIQYTSGAILENMTINGGNTQAKTNLTGDNIHISSKSFGSNINFRNVTSIYAKHDGISMTKFGYSYLDKVRSLASGNDNFVFSDCTTVFSNITSNAGQYGLHIDNCVNMKFTGINEHNYGVHITGSTNLALEFNSFYAEWIYPISSTTYANSLTTATFMDNILWSGDASSAIQSISISGCTKSNVGNAEGVNAYYNRLYIAITNDEANTTVNIYKNDDLSSSSLVAKGSIAEKTGKVTLAEQNESGITGSIDINYTQDENLITVSLCNNFITIEGSILGLLITGCYMQGLAPIAQISGSCYRLNILGSAGALPKIVPPNWGICDMPNVTNIIGTNTSFIHSSYGSRLENISFGSPAHSLQAMLLANTTEKIITFQEKQEHSSSYTDRVYIKKVGNLIARSVGFYPTPTSLVGNGEIFLNSASSNALSYKDYTSGTIHTITLT